MNEEKKIIHSDIKDKYPEIEDLMFKNKKAISKHKKNKNYKKWLREKKS